MPSIYIEGKLAHLGTLNKNKFIVGQSYHQDELHLLFQLARPGFFSKPTASMYTVANLVPEPNSPYDANSVAVYVGGLRVGYLAREIAEAYRKRFGDKPALMNALLVHNAGRYLTIWTTTCSEIFGL